MQEFYRREWRALRSKMPPVFKFGYHLRYLSENKIKQFISQIPVIDPKYDCFVLKKNNQFRSMCNQKHLSNLTITRRY